ncbi:MAG: HAMP domain-containing histidine kinase [Lachnospiraceae bacterium]|nr:HAMP domain-containing histidine kinase [Lachnospiraceae bacterium]
MRYLLMISVIANVFLMVKIIAMRQSVRQLRLDYEERMNIHTNTLLRVSSRDKQICKLASSMNATIIGLRDAYHRYEQGDNEIKTAITNIAHDLRTPLTAILGYLDLCKKEDQSEDMKRYLSIITDRALHMKKLTEELFSYSIASAEEVPEEKQEVFVNRVLEDCIMDHYPSFEKRGIMPVLDITQERIVRMLYPSYVERIITNLLNNAVKYSDGDLEISLSGDGKLRVANSAKELSNVDVNKLFDRFFTVENARNNSTGLGLSIVKLFAARMDCGLEAKYEDGKLVIEIQF